MDQIYVAIDVETTGLEAGVDEIIEIAAVKFRADEVLETFDTLVQPRHSLPLNSSRLTGITAEMLAGAPRFAEVAPRFAAFLKHYPLVGHNVGFDIRMLQAQGMRLPQPAFDTFELATLLMPRTPAYRLSALAETLGIVHSEAHRALSDADVTRQVFLHLLKRIAALSLNDLNEIVRLTARIDWTLRPLFEEAQRAKALRVFVDETPISAADSREPEEKLTPLKPTGNDRPIDLAEIRRFFSPNGALGRAFAGYEQRDQQVRMSEAVADALNQGGALIAEAGTGTGKGLAYLVPAALHAARRGERVVISTNTINLQDQLFFKDIPTLQKVMSNGATDKPPFTAALLKGRSNYLCLKRYHDLRRDQRLMSDDVRALIKVQLWLRATESGDRAELPLQEGEQATWNKLSAAWDQCTGPRCSEFHRCFFFKARRQAEAAHLVIVNHALLIADLAVENDVIPPYDYLIIDEAHNLEDVATDQLSFNVDREGLLAFLDSIFVEEQAQIVGGLLSELPNHFRGSMATQIDIDRADSIAAALRPAVARARDAVYGCFNTLIAFVRREADLTADTRLRITNALRRKPSWAEVERAWESLSSALTAVSEGLGQLESLLIDLKDAELLEYDALLLRVQALRRYATEVRINIGHILIGGAEEKVTWLNHDRLRDTLTLSAAPLSVAEILRTNLFERKTTTVLTSATLSVGGDFRFFRERIGLAEAEELTLDSPFDYTRQALLYIPDDIPEPSQPGYQRAVEQAIIDLARATNGRMLVLFTAINALRQTYRAIQEPLEDAGIAVLGQGIDGSRRSLLERFKEFPGTVLLGTASFWEGVDVVGEALSVLVIAKLPFSVPTDPIFAARSEQFDDAFNQYAVPQSILRFKQGFGRLIRSKDDRGVVAVLDRRLLTKKYGQTFLDSLPHTTVRSGPLQRLPDLARRFLAAGNGATNGASGETTTSPTKAKHRR
ncbi:MAG: exonuclease domain-containing protein [Roseiflexus sp.]|nr:exonuclease domain-containing protein [Roseiflexus sp.]MCS7290133.1 exonuclease domain-containing protein [Roseiflexus sp.]MDW8147344.1 helicase C-terminal domain-containing protein [Roseiflexaceae bacterium]